MKRNSRNLLVGLIVGGVLLWLSLRQVDFSRVGTTLKAVDPLLVLTAILVGQSSNGIRAWRWRLLLSKSPGIARLFAWLAIGYLANNALPARLGELARVESLKRYEGIPRGLGLSSIILEKVFDGLTLCLILGCMLLLHDFPDWVSWIGALSVAAFGGAALFALLCLRYRSRVLRVAETLLKPLGGIGVTLLGLARSAAAGLEALKRPANFVQCLLLSCGIWGIEMVAVFLLFRAAGLQLGLWAALFTVTILSLGMLVPSPPGFVGTYEYFGSRALGVLGVEPSMAIAVTFLLHVQLLLATTAVGFLCLVATGRLNFSAIRSP